MEAQCVFCEVGTEFINLHINFKLPSVKTPWRTDESFALRRRRTIVYLSLHKASPPPPQCSLSFCATSFLTCCFCLDLGVPLGRLAFSSMLKTLFSIRSSSQKRAHAILFCKFNLYFNSFIFKRSPGFPAPTLCLLGSQCRLLKNVTSLAFACNIGVPQMPQVCRISPSTFWSIRHFY
jgi:hypothetical protein